MTVILAPRLPCSPLELPACRSIATAWFYVRVRPYTQSLFKERFSSSPRPTDKSPPLLAKRGNLAGEMGNRLPSLSSIFYILYSKFLKLSAFLKAKL